MTCRLSVFAVIAFAAFAAGAWAEDATPSPPAEGTPAPAAPPVGPTATSPRWITFSLGPTFYYLFDHATQTTLGKEVYGGELRFRYHPVPWFAIGFNPGYLVGQQHSTVNLGPSGYQTSFQRLTSSSLTVLNVGLYAQILPFHRVNPFVGVTGGAGYYSGRLEPQNINSPLPLGHDALTSIVNRWAADVGGEAGLDVRITPWFGVFAIGFCQYYGAVQAQLAIPGAVEKIRFPLSQAGATAGIIVYY